MMNYDVLVCGAGIPGMAMAAILHKAGLNMCLIDAGPAPAPYDPSKPDGRTIALMGAAIETLDRAGLWQHAKPHASPLIRMRVIDDSRFPAGADKMLEQTFDSAELGRDAFGWNTPLTALRAAFKPQKGLTFLPATRLTALHEGTATLDNGTVINARLVIGADGRNSAVRTLSGLECTRRPYGQTAIVCVIGHTRPHNDTSTEFHRPGGPFTLVPMQNNQSAIVWVEKDVDASAMLRLPRNAFTAAISDRTRARLGTITLLSTPASFPLEYMRTPVLTAPRTALMAEAAHVMSPIGAQGMNLSLRDVATLADLVINARQAGLDIGSATVLNAYARARKTDVFTRTAAIDLANQLVANDSGLLRKLRRLGLHALTLPGPLRRIAMKSGLSA